MSLRICEEIWLQKVLSDLHQDYEVPMNIANNLLQHGRTKHVEIDGHSIKEKLNSGSICISYIPSSLQIVDILTK